MTNIYVTPMDKEVHRREISRLVKEAKEMSTDSMAEYLVDNGVAHYESAFRAGVESAIKAINASNSPYMRSYLQK